MDAHLYTLVTMIYSPNFKPFREFCPEYLDLIDILYYVSTFAAVMTVELYIYSGPASSGQSPSYRSTKRGACVASLHCQQCGGEDLGRCQVQTECGPEGHTGWNV